MLQTAKFSIEEFEGILASGVLGDRQLELLQGDLVEMPSEGSAHSGLANLIADYLRGLLGDRARIREGYHITLPDLASEPIPDIAIVKPSPDFYRSRNPYPSDSFWLIEVAYSSLKKDLGIKAALYAQAGIPEYWMVDVNAEILIVHRGARGGTFRSVQERIEGTLSPLAFPDVAVSIPIILGQ